MGEWTLGKRIDEDRGGFGIVYEVTHSNGKKGALKELKYPNTERLKRFEREINLLQTLNHNHILDIYEFNLKGSPPTVNGPYYIMEYMAGGSLRGRMNNMFNVRNGLFKRKWALEIVILPILEALQLAHSKPNYHRDIKPANLLFTTTAHNHIKVADWGLGKDVNRESTALTVGGMGTAGYCSPEQWLYPSVLGEVDERTDIYSLGIIFYEMMTGNIPQVFNSITGQRFQIPNSPSQNHSSISPQLDNAILKMMAYEAKDRYQNIQQVKNVLIPIFNQIV